MGKANSGSRRLPRRVTEAWQVINGTIAATCDNAYTLHTFITPGELEPGDIDHIREF